MRDIIELSKEVPGVLENLQGTTYPPQEKIIILQSAASMVQNAITLEVAFQSMKLTLENIHGKE